MSANLGLVVRGSLSKGLEVRLSEEADIEELAVGRFVVVEGANYLYHCLLTDLTLEATADISDVPPPPGKLREALAGAGVGTMLTLRPMLTTNMDAETDDEDAPKPARSLPPHFSLTRLATEQDVEAVFGKESEDGKHFSLGTPPEMDTPVCINFERFVERSSGIFGKTGTGKTFLTRVILGGLMRWDGASCLIFDAHDEYAKEKRYEGSEELIPTLSKLFNNVDTLTLDDPSADNSPLTIAHSDVEPEDVMLLRDVLGLPPTFEDVASAFKNAYGKKWLTELINVEDPKKTAEELGLHSGSLAACHRKAGRLRRLPYLVEDRQDGIDPAQRIAELLMLGRHVIVEMGGAEGLLGYLFAANVITRRLHDLYVDETKKREKANAESPRSCVVVLEEAHRLIGKEMAGDTIFGTIARELRKFHVSLMLIDQRPSGIDTEVLSQLGTKVIALLDDPRDLEAALSGQQDAAELRRMVARLATKQQALVLGHAVPMPVVLSIRTYDSDFADAVSSLGGDSESAEDIKARLGFD